MFKTALLVVDTRHVRQDRVRVATEARMRAAGVLLPRPDAVVVADMVADTYEDHGFMIAVREAVRADVQVEVAISMVEVFAPVV